MFNMSFKNEVSAYHMAVIITLTALIVLLGCEIKGYHYFSTFTVWGNMVMYIGFGITSVDRPMFRSAWGRVLATPVLGVMSIGVTLAQSIINVRKNNMQENCILFVALTAMITAHVGMIVMFIIGIIHVTVTNINEKYNNEEEEEI